MKSILFIFSYFFSLNLFGQINNNFELTKYSDTANYFEYVKPIIEKLNLIKPINNKIFFRLSSPKYYLELSKESNKYLIYANEIWKGEKTGEIFIKQIDLSKKQVSEINSLIDSLNINDIPSGNQIKNWTSGFDGITYIFELKNKNKYSFKNYWSPSSQEKFEESNKINFFLQKLDDIINYQKNNEEFEREVPYFNWKRDGTSWNVVKAITKENKAEYKKYKKKKNSKL
ncbi:hypothetical protein [Chishuiella sp.]|uniref:hypothetical protein n=1 Tax=Chishuiella sp. TaxID=1969467 RepID=UPI0028ACB87B|nr:hypothetical protein [Chishuiella sp.]